MDATDRLRRLRVAMAGLEGGRFEASGQVCRELLADNPDDIDALLLLGLALGKQGEVDAAAPILNRIARERPNHAHPCRDLAQIAQYQACLRLTPDDVQLRFGLAELLVEDGEPAEAIALLEPVLRMSPDSAEAHYRLGQALAEIGQFAVAAGHFQRAIANDPAPAAFWANLGMVLKVEGHFDEALDAYAQALARDPANSQIRVNRAVARLHAGRLAEAWQDAAWRLEAPGRTPLPSLSRLGDLTGRTVLVVQEEGLGDTLQFMRYLPLLAERGAHVAVAVPPALTRILRSVAGVAAVPEGSEPVPRHDFYCTFNGLPRAFETTLDTIPHHVPYLSADPALVRAWAGKLPTDAALRVGLVWAGQARPWLPGFANLDRRRSTSLETLAPLGAIKGVHFVSLQKGAAVGSGCGLDLLDVMDQVQDFADTAAIVANLDLVISVDTSVVHLAGAMGKPVFLLDRYDNCWRWLSGRDDSPWYPSLRIFRQQQSGEWGPVIARVATALSEMAATGGRPSLRRPNRDAA